MSTRPSEDDNLRDPLSDEEPEGDEISPQIEEIEEESVDPARWEYTSEQFNKLGRLKLFNIYQRHGRTIFYHYSGGNKTKFVPALLATFLEIMNPVITIRPSVASSKDYGDMWYYDWDKGTYVPNAETYFIEKVKNIWGDSFNASLITQTFFNMRAETYIDREQFDLDLKFIPVKNGVLKLEKNIVDDIDQFFSELPIESGWKESLVPNNPNIYVINRIPVEYKPSALCNNWLEFLSKTFDVPDIAFLQEWCGSILYRKIFGVGKAVILVGPTRTGKGTFIYTIETLIGDSNTVKMPLQNIKDSYERARTYKKLLCSWSDIDKIAIQESGFIKTLISGDKQSGRYLYENPFDFQPYIKIIQSANVTPQADIDRDDWWERFNIIFVHSHQYFDDDPEFNPNLKAELTTPEELRGILNWALKGLLRYIENGYRFSNCPNWQETRRRWKLWGDSVNAFMESNWVTYDERDAETTKPALFDHFLRYCTATNRRELMTMSKFGRVIRERYVRTGQIEDTLSSIVLPDGSRPHVWRGVKIVSLYHG